MKSSGRRAKTTSEPLSLIAALIDEQPSDQAVFVRQQQQHEDGVTSCLPLRSKWTAIAASAFSLFRPATATLREFKEDNGKSIKASTNNYEYEETS
ncbi:hypothetical protein H5410_057926 [Solanum commersonii]|uniref:Uncharacterized protein n=1 Tax=Solanum commersonii TaxID=4109 RepID=A0A9J5WS40_SOLCO|nr:hypothetical protein H5410_057926 [Solanum commersonii]